MEINDADVAELVDARDLKSPGATEITHLSDLTRAGNPHEAGGDPAILSNTPPPLRAGWKALENVGRRLFTDIASCSLCAVVSAKPLRQRPPSGPASRRKTPAAPYPCSRELTTCLGYFCAIEN